MNHQASGNLSLKQIQATLLRYPLRWIVPAVAISLFAAFYAYTTPGAWEASQALTIRDEAIGGARAGKFSGMDDLKSAQETVVELAKSRAVCEAALQEVGAPTGFSGSWPTDGAVADLQSGVAVKAPNGVEFGRTDVFYLKVRDASKDRALALAGAMCNQIEVRLKQLRDRQSLGLVEELQKTVSLAQADLDEATKRMADIEKSVGSDLSELRILSESASGESNLRMTLTQTKNDLRDSKINLKANRQLLEQLQEARKNPVVVANFPGRLLEAQPALRRLKDGLVDAQLHSSQLMGLMSADHPSVIAAKSSEEEIRVNLQKELTTAEGSLTAETQLLSGRVEALQQQAAVIEDRLAKLGTLRASYSNLAAECRHRTDILKKAQESLSDARANQAASHSASRITRLDTPDAGVGTVGPKRSLILLAGVVGGLLTGFGVVLLTAPVEKIVPSIPYGRLRRATDRVQLLAAAPAVHEVETKSRDKDKDAVIASREIALRKALRTNLLSKPG